MLPKAMTVYHLVYHMTLITMVHVHNLGITMTYAQNHGIYVY